MKSGLSLLLSGAVVLLVGGCDGSSRDVENSGEEANQPKQRWDERPSATWTRSKELRDSMAQWSTGEYLSFSGPINMRYYTTPSMVDGLPNRIEELEIGMSQTEVESHLAQDSGLEWGFAWGFNTMSHGLEPIPEGVHPEEITYHYQLTEINAEHTASRNRLDLLIHWKCNYPIGEEFKLTYLGAKLIPARW